MTTANSDGTERGIESPAMPSNPIVENYRCPACGAVRGEHCHTPVGGVLWDATHDLRVYCALVDDMKRSLGPSGYVVGTASQGTPISVTWGRSEDNPV